MNIFTLSQTKRTPEIIFNIENSELFFNGSSIPEDVNLFYAPLMSWVEINKESIVEKLIPLSIKVNLSYFNSSTLKFLVSMFKYLINLKGTNLIEIIWFYDQDDEDLLETAIDISNILLIPIKCIVR